MLNDKQDRKLRRMKKHFLPAIPPDDYEGSVADWHYALLKLELWNGEDPSEIMDIKLNRADYHSILAICEGK